jgi:hypothetical protein
MIVWASGLGMREGRLSSLHRGVGVIAKLDVGLDTMQRGEVAQGAGVLRLLVPGVAVGEFIVRRVVSDGVEVTR